MWRIKLLLLVATLPAFGQITKTQTAKFQSTTGNVSAVVVTLASAPSVGQVMYAYVGLSQYTAGSTPPNRSFTAPSGWTFLDYGCYGLDCMYVYRRVVQTGDGTTYTFSINTSAGYFYASGVISVFSGMNTTTPEIGHGISTGEIGTGHNSPSISTSTTGTLPISAVLIDSGAPGTPNFNSSGWTLDADAASTYAAMLTGVGTSSTAFTTEQAQWNLSTSNYGLSELILLAPAAGGGGGGGGGGSGIVPSTTAAVVQVNGTTTVSFNKAVTVTLSTNTSASISACSGCTSVTITGPSVGPLVPMQGGCPTTPADSIFTTPITNLPVNPNSSAWMTRFTTYGNGQPIAWGFFQPANPVDNSTPGYLYSHHYTTYLNSTPFQRPPLAQMHQENGIFGDEGNSDRHSLTVNHQTCQFYDLYGPSRSSNATASGDTWAWANPTSTVLGPYDLTTSANGGSTVAAGYPLSKTVVTDQDFKSGVIRHPIPITVGAGQILGTYYSDYPTCHTIQSATYWPSPGGGPAGSCDGVSLNTAVTGYGALMRLKAATDISAYSAGAQIFLNAYKNYGAILEDIGYTSQPMIDANCEEDPACLSAMNEVQYQLPFTAHWDFVDQHSLETCAVQDSSCASSRVDPSNSYVTPSAYAVLNVSDGGVDTPITIPIAIQPVGVGMAHENYTVQAGTLASGHQFTWWVTGASNQAVTWALTSGVGTVTSGGLYTPPATVASPTRTILTGTAAADSTAHIYVCLIVIPKGSNPANSIRVDVGSSSNTVDDSGNTWLADTLTHNYGGASNPGNDYPNWTSAVTPLHAMYGTRRYSAPGDDSNTGPFLIDAGQYLVTFYAGVGGSGYGSIAFINDEAGAYVRNSGPRYLGANGIIQKTLDIYSQIGYRNYQPASASIPVLVGSDHVLVATEYTTGSTATGYSAEVVSGVQIVPDSGTTPHIEVDLQQHDQVKPGTTAQFGETDYYSNTVCQSPVNNGNTTCTWSILSGPGSITNNGLYTAPTSLAATARVKVQVTNGTYSAVGIFRVIGSSTAPAAISH